MIFLSSSLIHSIATRVIKLAHAKSSLALAPALVETYSRLLVYMEIESLGIKGFISKNTCLFDFSCQLEAIAESVLVEH